MEKVQKSVIQYLNADLELVQNFMNEQITSEQPRTAKWIFSQLSDKLSKKLTEAQFQQSLSVHTRLGNITGFEGRRRVGYVVAGTPKVARITPDSEDSLDNVEDESESLDIPEKMALQVTRNVRIVHLDKRNFGRQVLSNGAWVNSGFYPTMYDALKGTARYLLNKKIRTHEGIVDIKDAMAFLKKLELSIFKELKEAKLEIASDINDLPVVEEENPVAAE